MSVRTKGFLIGETAAACARIAFDTRPGCHRTVAEARFCKAKRSSLRRT